MKAEQILARPSRVLSRAQRAHFFDNGSLANDSDRASPLLLQTYSAADALTLTPRPTRTRHEGKIVRGQPARWVRFDPEPCQLPPDRTNQSHLTIFSTQQRERSL